MSAFNVEPYLRKSLECIVNQTFTDTEIICMNDGSTDGTLAILEEFAAKDDRIIVIDKKVNQGLAVARNEALDLAKGKYVAFVDGDDLFDLDLFRKAYECAEENACDLLFWDYAVFWDERGLKKQRQIASSLNSVSPTDKSALLKRPAFAWTKLVRTDAAKSLGVTFPKGLTRQDIPVHWQLITQLDKIAIIPERLAFYRQHASATTHRTDKSNFDMIRVYDIVKDFLIENDLFDQYRDVFRFLQTNVFCNVHDNTPKSSQAAAMSMILERLDDDALRYTEGKNDLSRRVLDFYAALGGSKVAKIRRHVRRHTRDVYRALRSLKNEK